MAIEHLIFLYDPFCGWCYGAMPAIHALADNARCIVEAAPSGLFAGEPTRRIDASLAEHMLSTDARVASMSGQRFSDLYRRRVLNNRELPFDSGPATEALTAVSRWNVQRELDGLHALQRERFVAGRDISDRNVIAEALASALGDDSEIWHKRLADPALARTTQLRLNRTRQIMNSVGVQGVPALVWPSDKGLRLLPGQWFFNGKPLADALAVLA